MDKLTKNSISSPVVVGSRHEREHLNVTGPNLYEVEWIVVCFVSTFPVSYH